MDGSCSIGKQSCVVSWESLKNELVTLPTPELLHRYNDAKDLAHTLMSLIAQRRQCTIADVYVLLDVVDPDCGE